MSLRVAIINCVTPTYYSVASFLAVIAYPSDASAEEMLRDQLCLAFLMSLSLEEKRPILVEAPISIFKSRFELSILRRGLKKLQERFWIGYHVVLPDADMKEPESFTVGLEDMLKNTLGALGAKNLSTGKTKIWKPAWPVFHGAGAFAYLFVRYTQSTCSPGSEVEFLSIVFALMAQNGIEKDIVLLAEEIREAVLQKRLYKKINFDNTVEFRLVNSEAEKTGFASSATSSLKGAGSPFDRIDN